MVIELPRAIPAPRALILMLASLVASPREAEAQPASNPPPASDPLPPNDPAPASDPLPASDPPPPPASPWGAPPPPLPVGPSWELLVSELGAFYAIHATPPGVDQSGARGLGTLQLTRYFAPLVDDDAPWSLQPFLQRASVVYGSVSGGGFATRIPTPGSAFTSTTRTDANVGARFGVDAYVTPAFALTGALGYGYDVLHDGSSRVNQHAHGFSASGGFGLRYLDVRFDVAYSFSASDADGSWSPLRWGTVLGSAYIVIDRRAYVNLWGRVLQSGGGGGVDLGLYPTQQLGLFASGYGERGELYSDPPVFNRAFADAGLSYWFTSRVRLAAYYEFTFNDEPSQSAGSMNFFGYTELEHAFRLEGAFRIR